MIPLTEEEYAEYLDYHRGLLNDNWEYRVLVQTGLPLHRWELYLALKRLRNLTWHICSLKWAKAADKQG